MKKEGLDYSYIIEQFIKGLRDSGRIPFMNEREKNRNPSINIKRKRKADEVLDADKDINVEKNIHFSQNSFSQRKKISNSEHKQLSKDKYSQESSFKLGEEDIRNLFSQYEKGANKDNYESTNNNISLNLQINNNENNIIPNRKPKITMGKRIGKTPVKNAKEEIEISPKKRKLSISPPSTIKKVASKKTLNKNYKNPPEGPLNGMSIVFTGELENIDREDMEEIVFKLGAIVGKNVSKKTTHLVYGAHLYDGRAVEQGVKWKAALKHKTKDRWTLTELKSFIRDKTNSANYEFEIPKNRKVNAKTKFRPYNKVIHIENNEPWPIKHKNAFPFIDLDALDQSFTDPDVKYIPPANKKELIKILINICTQEKFFHKDINDINLENLCDITKSNMKKCLQFLEDWAKSNPKISYSEMINKFQNFYSETISTITKINITADIFRNNSSFKKMRLKEKIEKIPFDGSDKFIEQMIQENYINGYNNYNSTSIISLKEITKASEHISLADFADNKLDKYKYYKLKKAFMDNQKIHSIIAAPSICGYYHAFPVKYSKLKEVTEEIDQVNKKLKDLRIQAFPNAFKPYSVVKDIIPSVLLSQVTNSIIKNPNNKGIMSVINLMNNYKISIDIFDDGILKTQDKLLVKYNNTSVQLKTKFRGCLQSSNEEKQD